MHSKVSGIRQDKTILSSTHLQREVAIDFYITPDAGPSNPYALLLINDGQNLPEMDFAAMLGGLFEARKVRPLVCVAIHADKDRKREYGVAGVPDYLGRGDRAGDFSKFVLEELLPFLDQKFPAGFGERMYAGFSLGGLMALDIAWEHADVFSHVGVFSGSLWWRSVDQEDPAYDDDQHRIIHQKIRKGAHRPGLKFFFQCGNMDETMDRNNNGIIDSIDDTRDLIRELEGKGYVEGRDIYYLEMPDGRHDIPTWGRAMALFLTRMF